jgi:hypothetical protein
MKKIPKITKDQSEQLLRIAPVGYVLEEVNHDNSLESALYSYHYSAVSRAYIDLLKKFHGKQAELDSVMLEYCPQDMSKSQLKEYESCQVVVNTVKSNASKPVSSVARRVVVKPVSNLVEKTS